MKRATVVALVGVVLLLVLAAPAHAVTAPTSYLLTINTYWDANSDGVWGVNERVMPGERCQLWVNGAVRCVTTDKCGVAKVSIPCGALVTGQPTLNPLAGYPNPYYTTEASPRLAGSDPPMAKVIMKGARCIRFGLAPHRGRMVVGTSAGYPPFEFVVNGELVGFDIDLVNEIADRLDYVVVWKDLPFGDLFTELQACRLDMAAAAITITDGRKLVIDFSDPYYTEPGGQLGFGFPKCSTLRPKVNGALGDMMADGTYDAIYDKWFGVSEAAFEVHLTVGGESLFFKGWIPGSNLSVAIDRPSTAASPDFQTSIVAAPNDPGQDGFGAGVAYAIQPGDVITVYDGVTLKTHQVIDIQVTSVDVAADTVSGTVPTGGTDVMCYIADVGGVEAVANASGGWTADFSALTDIVSGTQGGAEQFDNDGDSTVRDWSVP